MINIWDNTTTQNGIFYQIEYADSSNVLYVSGQTDSIADISQVNRLNSTIDCTYILPNSQLANSIPNDIKLIEGRGHIAITGASYKTSHSDLMFDIISLNGDSLYSYIEEDELHNRSMGLTAEVLDNNVIWFGGAINTITNSKNGFTYNVEHPTWVSDTVVIVDDLEIESNSLMNEFLVYPNPVQSKLNITSLNDGSFSFIIYDISGKLCYSETRNTTTIIDLDFLKPGIYVLKISKGKQTAFVKLIKYQN